MKELLAEVAKEIESIQHADRVRGEGFDLLHQRLDGLRTKIADAIAADDARIAAEAEQANRS
jgi:hypothetical protein